MPPHEAAVQPFPLFLRPPAGMWGQPATVTREESKETGLRRWLDPVKMAL